MRPSTLTVLAALIVGAGPVRSQTPRRIIDAHVHVTLANFPTVLAALRQHGVVLAVASGRRKEDIPELARLADAAGVKLFSGFISETELLGLSSDSLDARFAGGTFNFVGELAPQYVGVAPNDPAVDPIFKWAQARDLPVGLHMGLTQPGIALGRRPAYRVSLGNPLLLEDVLVRYPRLRLWVMHAGNPFLQEMIGLLSMFPDVYVDLSAAGCSAPRSDTGWCPLRDLVSRGFEDRLMFGTDVAADTSIIAASIAYIERAEFLTPAQRDKIFCLNAQRFFRLAGVCDGHR
jgi:predicted TIM-barrel fold metal-dependent hydrolase